MNKQAVKARVTSFCMYVMRFLTWKLTLTPIVLLGFQLSKHNFCQLLGSRTYDCGLIREQRNTALCSLIQDCDCSVQKAFVCVLLQGAA